MDIKALQEARNWIQSELERCLEFWLKHGMDTKHGGVYTCLDRKGEIFSTDKSVWMQGRCGWLFAWLCNTYGRQEQWLAASKSCIDFLERHCVNSAAGGRLYFTVTADGKPLRQRRYCFSEAFAAIANAEYSLAAKDAQALARAREYYELIWKLNNGLIKDPAGLGPKTIAETRSSRSLADPMIYLNVTGVLRRCDPERKALYDERAAACANAIIRYHHKPELRCTLETVGTDGEFQREFTAGRVVNPGHDMECCWFLLEEAAYRNDFALRGHAVRMFDYALEAGWDTEYGGLLYFVDCLGKPPEAYEHDMKLWWPHNELLIASLMIYRDTGDEKYLDSFLQTLEYCRNVFSDPEYGEWFGYLRRDGKPTEPPCKGSTFKGPFHLPRMLVKTEQMLKDIISQNQ